ncbi:MAG: hypothetical protein FJ147_21425 [Deltaproteobacteria bacterium]|nr:hypothetical protein [Deltaproteobacteria bacterium]
MTDDTLPPLLRRWADNSTKLLREARGLEQRYIGYRDWSYHNLAWQLCRRYRRILVTILERQTACDQRDATVDAISQHLSLYYQLTAPARFVPV